MYKKGEYVVMTQRSAPKLPNVKENGSFRTSYIRGSTILSHERLVKTHVLPGIGTFVIDTPKDKELSARQRCFRYQEAHRGVVRSKTKAFPDIPKRCDMKNLPIVQLRDMNVKANENTTPTRHIVSPVECQEHCVSPSLAESGVSCQSIDGHSAKSRKQEPALKVHNQDGPASKSPIGRIVQISEEHQGPRNPVMVNGFGVRRGKSVVDTIPGTASRREFTNLTKNLLLTEPESTPCKATERELESQAEYRKQLTFYLSQMFEAEQEQAKKPRKEHTKDLESPSDVNDENIHVDNIGHTSKHQEWESSICLGEMLINTTPDLRKRLGLDFKIRETGSGKSSNATPEMSKQNGRHLTQRGLDSVINKTCRNSNANNNSSNHCSSNNNNNNICSDKSPLPPKRRPTCVNSQHVKLTDHYGGSFMREKTTGSMNNTDNEEEDEEGDVCYIQNDNMQIEDEEENNDSEEEDQYDDIVDEKWLHMVNTPVVESWVYDRYANVKLPPSWLQPHPWNSLKRHSPVKTSKNSISGNRVVPGACAMSGGATSSLSVASGKAGGFVERKTAGRVK